MPGNPFGDYSNVDLSSIYFGNQTPGAGLVPAGAPGTIQQPQQAQNPAGQQAPNGTPYGQSPLAGNPAASPQDMSAYYQAQAGAFQGGYSPYQGAVIGRGENPMNNRPAPNDASPEANLPGNAYAGTVYASALSPEQAAGVRYNTPELAAFLQDQVAQGNGDHITFTRNALQQAYSTGQFAGDPNDLMAAIQASRQADYGQYVARLRASGVSYIPDQATYERGMGLQPINPGAAQGTYAPTGTPTANSYGQANYGMPVSAPTPDYTSQAQSSIAAGSPVRYGAAPIQQAPAQQPAAPNVDYQALAATDRRYAQNLAATDPAKSKMYLDRAVEYESRAGMTTASTPTAGRATV